MNWNRISAFLSLAGLAAFLPAVFVPAMLVANAVVGPQLFSVWTGIREFHRLGHYYLAALIFCFSILFPVVKFTLCLACAAGRNVLPRSLRRRIVAVTAWTAKYSMLDVMVMAMAIMLVKVDEYVRILPSAGIYLFSAAILCSALAGAALSRALRQEETGDTGPGTPLPRRLPWLAGVAAGSALAAWGIHLIRTDDGGAVTTVRVTRLTNRGDLRRSVEKTIALRELASDDHEFWSHDTMRRLLEFSQAVSTDAGWREPEAWVSIQKHDRGWVQSEHLAPVNLDEPGVNLVFSLPVAVPRHEIAVVKLVTNVQYMKLLDAPIDEEYLTVDGDPFRRWSRVWHGRIFNLGLEGSRSGSFAPGVAALSAGLLAGFWSLASLITPGRVRRRAAAPATGR